MNKKHKDISVDDCEYAWLVREVHWPEMSIRIWLKDQNKIPWCNIDYDDPTITIKPNNIAQIIRKVVLLKRNAQDSSLTLNFRSGEFGITIGENR